MGRSSIDLYSNDVGAPFEEITSFAAYVGGSPTNISVGLSRLGQNVALLTAVGDDPVGDFVLRFLAENRVDASASPRKAGKRTSAVLLGIEPPDRFPLVFYRDNCADIELTIDDVLGSPVDDCHLFQFFVSTRLHGRGLVGRGRGCLQSDVTCRLQIVSAVESRDLPIQGLLRTGDPDLGLQRSRSYPEGASTQPQ